MESGQVDPARFSFHAFQNEVRMKIENQGLGEEYVKLALAINEHLPGYVDAYFGPEEWKAQTKQDGKLSLPDLTERVDRLAKEISRSDSPEVQRKDFLGRQISAMQMSLRLLTGEKVSLAEEVHELYDVDPSWKDESNFEEAHRELDELLPAGISLSERMQEWKRSLEMPLEMTEELLGFITTRLRGLAHSKFDLPEEETFALEFVSDQPWYAYNWYLGGYRSKIEINTDLPAQVDDLADLIAHEGYPGHHTELSIKESKLVRQKNYIEHTITILNSPSCVIAEGVATTALKTLLTDNDLEEWYRKEILPRAGMSHIDSQRMARIGMASQKITGLAGNAAFMFHDQQKSEDEIMRYIQRFGLRTEKEARQTIKFISNPLYRSYIFTYHVGHDLLETLFTKGDRTSYFKRILEEPVTPHQIREWINDR